MHVPLQRGGHSAYTGGLASTSTQGEIRRGTIRPSSTPSFLPSNDDDDDDGDNVDDDDDGNDCNNNDDDDSNDGDDDDGGGSNDDDDDDDDITASITNHPVLSLLF
jgi:hypothetical protein